MFIRLWFSDGIQNKSTHFLSEKFNIIIKISQKFPKKSLIRQIFMCKQLFFSAKKNIFIFSYKTFYSIRAILNLFNYFFPNR